MTYYCRIKYEEAWDMPVSVRKWWIRRVMKENEKRQQELDKLKNKK